MLDWKWTYIVAVEGVEDSRDVAAQDADGNPRIIQRHPAAAGLLRAVATEQVITHGTQHAQLKMERSRGEDKVWVEHHKSSERDAQQDDK